MKSRCQITGLPLERFICRFMYWFIHPSIRPSNMQWACLLCSSHRGHCSEQKWHSAMPLWSWPPRSAAGHSLHMVAPVGLGLDPRGWVQVRDTNMGAMAMLTAWEPWYQPEWLLLSHHDMGWEAGVPSMCWPTQVRGKSSVYTLNSPSCKVPRGKELHLRREGWQAVSMCLLVVSCIRLFEIPWTVAHQALLSMSR